jgi:hypothetical protein
MVAEKQPVQKSYSIALRVVGRYLDGEPSYHVSIAETGNGLTVRSHATPRRADERVKHFAWDTIEDMDQYYSAAARGLGAKERRLQWAFPCTHEQALRTLGAILDNDSAGNLSVDETASGLDVSYTSEAKGAGQHTRQQKLFGPDELCRGSS